MPRYERIDGGRTTFAIAVDDSGAPRLLHFGTRLPNDLDLSEIDAASRIGPRESTPDLPILPSLYPAAGMGWFGEPAISGVREGGDDAIFWSATTVERSDQALAIRLVDQRMLLRVELSYAIDPETGVLASRACIHNDHDKAFRLQQADSLCLPLPAWATDILCMSGDWSREAQPFRLAPSPGAWSQTNRTGRTGFPGSTFAVLDTTAGDHTGRVLAVHLAWSGNHRLLVETLPSGQRMALAGLHLAPGEVELAPRGIFETPTAYACFSDNGLNGVSDAFHPFVRTSILPRRMNSVRRVHFNSWEAAYFSFDEASLKELASAAADIGIERFVVDDGWFSGRRDDTSSLGDWRVDRERFANGLGPLVEHVHQLGMDLGIWVEPEMVNADSDLYRAHPDWCVHARNADRPTMRNQLWLDMSRTEVRDHLFEQLDRLLSENDIAYLKWDCNRFLFPAVSTRGPAAAHIIRGTYALMDRLREAHPNVEIESCASGGARIDLEMLKRATRVWPSDSTDAIERVRIQRWANLILPLETIGAHVGPSPNPITGRELPMALRARVAMFGHLGVEMDPRKLNAKDRETLALHIALYKNFRGLLHSGRLLRWRSEDGADATICVSNDADEALALVCRTEVSRHAHAAPIRFPGLDRAARYRITLPEPWPEIAKRRIPDPEAWRSGQTFSARVLEETGLSLPVADPQTAWLIHLARI